MRHFFEIDGRKSKEYGLYISGSGTYDSPERDYNKVSIPGRSGDLIFDNGRYKNIELRYPAFIMQDFRRQSAEVRAWLLNSTGYRRIEDTYHPEEFRMGIYSGNIEFDMRALNRSGETELLFDCMPQRWLKTGEDMISLTEGKVIQNPTGFDALPLVRVYGSGTITIGESVIEVKDVSTYIYIDCETENAFRGAKNMNSKIYIQSGGFPILGKATEISFEGITKVDIKPRWWRI